MGRFAVLGAGIAGLSAAYELELAGHRVVVFDTAERIGGKLQQSEVPGLGFPVDDGADAFLARVPDALELCAELGIDDLVHPATGTAWVYAGDGLRPLPKAHLLGIPTDLDDLAATGLVSPAGLARAAEDLQSAAPPPAHDVSVGELVRDRLGDEICDRLVEPLLGGINGGEADGLSAQACAPQIWACAAQGGSLIAAAAAAREAAPATDGVVFAAPRAGMAELPRRLAARLSAEFRLGASVPSVHADRSGAMVGEERFDGVVVATPAANAAALTGAIDPTVAGVLAETEYASVVMVTAVARRDTVDHPLDGSGLVVARTADVAITAASWASSKWSHWDDGTHALFRISLGHDGDPTDWCALPDDELAATALADLSRVMSTEITPVGLRVGRWSRSFPQYRPGHLDRVAAARAALLSAGPVTLAGMSYDGIGVPACVRSGRNAARTLMG